MKIFEEKQGNQFLNQLKIRSKDIKFCVLGAGNGGMAMAGHLAIMGFRVNLYNRSQEKLRGVKWHGGIQITGEIKGFGEIALATTDIEKAISEVDILMVVVPAAAHAYIAEKCAPYVKDGQVIILNPGRTGGALEFRKIFIDKGVDKKIFLAEAQTFLYASRLTSSASAHIFRIKKEVPLATLPSYWIPGVLSVIHEAFPQFVPGDNVLKTSLDNIGAVFHPALTIFNTSWIEKTKGNFDFYHDGLSKSLSLLLEEIDRERVCVAAALGIKINSAREWLYQVYNSYGETLYEAIQRSSGYRGIKAPQQIDHRYVWEDVPYSLVPISSIGKMLGIKTPTIDAVIHISNILLKKNFWNEGRTVEKIGIAGLSVKEIMQLVTGS
ncbi:MAG: NAD/NADP octopine/nopaline dehydrogenase family protein [Candidatus Omnitrophica bacterium]|nr:NAD/NADP octopine/nopaline dehydrogenase family protein [Candidatus Omnitrophota bacterium]